MIIDNILSTLVQDHPDLLDTFEGGDWDKLVDGGYPEEVVIPVLRNIVEHAHYRGYLGERVVLLRKFGIYTLGKETLNGWQGFEIPMLNGESEILKEITSGESNDEGQRSDGFDEEEDEQVLEHHSRQENMKKSGFLGIPTKHYVIAGVVLCSAIIGFTLLNGGKSDNRKNSEATKISSSTKKEKKVYSSNSSSSSSSTSSTTEEKPKEEEKKEETKSSSEEKKQDANQNQRQTQARQTQQQPQQAAPAPAQPSTPATPASQPQPEATTPSSETKPSEEQPTPSSTSEEKKEEATTKESSEEKVETPKKDEKSE